MTVRFGSRPSLDLVFPALVCQPILHGLYDLYDEYDNTSDEVLVTDVALFTGSPHPIRSGKEDWLTLGIVRG
jgi:hypothetical protein